MRTSSYCINRQLNLNYFSWGIIVFVGMLILLKQVLIMNEVIVRPLFAWDAIDSWVQRSQEWFLQAPEHPFYYKTDTNEWYQGPWVERLGTYPHPFTSSLISLWGMSILNSHQIPAANIAWALTPLALAAVVSGHLIDKGIKPIPSAIGGYLVFSLPYVNVHAALPGYGDLWLTSYFTCAVLLACTALKRKSGAILIAALIATIGLITSKRLGILLAGTIMVPGIVLWLINSRKILNQIAIMGFSIRGISLLAAALVSLALTTIWGFELVIERAVTFVSSVVDVKFNNVFKPLATSFFYQNNWHITPLLFVMSTTLIVIRYCSRSRYLDKSIDTYFHIYAVLVMAIATMGVYAFSGKYYSQALEMTTMNRSLLISFPITIALCLSAIRYPER